MMKPQEHKQLFYLWDYIWWQGEMIKRHYHRPGRKIDGSFVLFLYITVLVIVPLIFLFGREFPDITFLVQSIVFCVITVAGYEWLVRIYRKRGKTVMKHNAKRNFNPVWAYFLSLFPFVILVMLVLCIFR